MTLNRIAMAPFWPAAKPFHRIRLPFVEPLKRSRGPMLVFLRYYGYTMDIMDIQVSCWEKTCLAGWWFQFLWKVLVSWDDDIPNIWKKSHVPNHQPDMFRIVLGFSMLWKCKATCLWDDLELPDRLWLNSRDCHQTAEKSIVPEGTLVFFCQKLLDYLSFASYTFTSHNLYHYHELRVRNRGDWLLGC